VLKFIFVLLLAANAALFAYGKGYLGQFSGNEREPARLQKQLNADKLQLIAANKAEAAAAQKVASPAPVAEPAPAAPEEVVTKVCVEVGDFLPPEARRFEDRVAALKLGARQIVRRNLPGQEISSYIVHIPPQGSRAAADQKADELRALGVTTFFVMNESSPLPWGISLGVFRSESAAQTQLATLAKQGVEGARVAPRYTANKHLLLQFRDVTLDHKASIEKIAARFPEQATRACSK